MVGVGWGISGLSVAHCLVMAGRLYCLYSKIIQLCFTSNMKYNFKLAVMMLLSDHYVPQTDSVKTTP